MLELSCFHIWSALPLPGANLTADSPSDEPYITLTAPAWVMFPTASFRTPTARSEYPSPLKSAVTPAEPRAAKLLVLVMLAKLVAFDEKLVPFLRWFLETIVLL